MASDLTTDLTLDLTSDAQSVPDWVPGGTANFLAESYVSYIVAVLCCLSEVCRSSQGIEPADLELQGVPSFVAAAWRQQSPRLCVQRLADSEWRTRPWVSKRHGASASFFELVQMLQVHRQPAEEPQLWQYWGKPWFPVALLGLNITGLSPVATRVPFYYWETDWELLWEILWELKDIKKVYSHREVKPAVKPNSEPSTSQVLFGKRAAVVHIRWVGPSSVMLFTM